MKNIKFLIIALFSLILSCSGDGVDPLEASGNNNLSGVIFFKWTNEISKFDLKTGKKSLIMHTPSHLYGWDISQDGKKIMTIVSGPTFDFNEIITIRNIESDEILQQFEYYSEDPSSNTMTGALSPDEQYVVMKPGVGNKYLEVVDMQGHQVAFLRGVPGGAQFNYDDLVVWMPDNTLLITAGTKIYRSTPSFDQFTLIKDMSDYASWGGLQPSLTGDKISLIIGNHIYLMNIDGGNLTQVTTSSSEERGARFSPDGKFLLVVFNWKDTNPIFGAGVGRMAIIKTDGKLYDLDNAANNPDIITIPGGEEGLLQAVSEKFLWR